MNPKAPLAPFASRGLLAQLTRTAVYGPVRTVVWQGSAGDRHPYADRGGAEAFRVKKMIASGAMGARNATLQSSTTGCWSFLLNFL